MCCGYGRHYHPHGMGGCCSHYHRYHSADEELELLKRNKKELDEEIADIEKRIEELKRQGK